MDYHGLTVFTIWRSGALGCCWKSRSDSNEMQWVVHHSVQCASNALVTLTFMSCAFIIFYNTNSYKFYFKRIQPLETNWKLNQWVDRGGPWDPRSNDLISAHQLLALPSVDRSHLQYAQRCAMHRSNAKGFFFFYINEQLNNCTWGIMWCCRSWWLGTF